MIPMIDLTQKLEWKLPSVIFCFVQGVGAKELYEKTLDVLGSGVWFNEEDKKVYGSNVPAAAKIDTLVKPFGIRVATPRDFANPEVANLISENQYSDSPYLVLRTAKDFYFPNSTLIEKIIDEVEEREGKLKMPLMISGFDVERAENILGWTICPRKDFSIVHDDRLDGKYSGRTFNKVDEIGLPIFEKRGSMLWLARSDGLSGICLCEKSTMYSGGEAVDYSNFNGRLILVKGESSSQILDSYLLQLQKKEEEQLQLLKQKAEEQHRNRLSKIESLAKELGLQ